MWMADIKKEMLLLKFSGEFVKSTDEQIVIKHDFNVSKEIIWNAITQVDRMREWFFDNIPSFEPRVGFETSFNIHNDGREFLHLWTILEVIPNELIKYNWKYEGYSGDSNVTFKIAENDKGVRLHLSMEILEDFPEDIPEFKRESCVAGWNYFIKERLPEYLNKFKK
jgi:uncharacterized protein YndB with AHSA1/START domain